VLGVKEVAQANEFQQEFNAWEPRSAGFGRQPHLQQLTASGHALALRQTHQG
jgi:hypothetical protein